MYLLLDWTLVYTFVTPHNSAEKEISTNREPDYYGIADVEKPEEIEDLSKLIIPFDIKNVKARGQKNIDPLTFFKIKNQSKYYYVSYYVVF